MATRGVVFIAYGEPARTEATAAIATLRCRHTWPVAVICDRPMGLRGVTDLIYPDQDIGARWAKVRLDCLSPYDHTLYLDADTRVHQDVDAGFAILDGGWDMVIAPSVHQGPDWLWHCQEGEREDTLVAWGVQPLALQAGVLFLARNERTTQLFSVWQREWEQRKDQDQGALLRALQQAPVRVWLLGRPWNGGAVIAHRFGQARRERRS